MKIEIGQIKGWREEIGATHIVVFSIDPDGNQHVATHGLTEQHASEAAKAGNKLKAALGWPLEKCRSRPVERVCRNCVFYEPDYGIHCFNGWTGDGTKGRCLYAHPRQPTVNDSRCGDFEPKVGAE